MVAGHHLGIASTHQLAGGHRDVFGTSCPGKNAYEAIPTINGLAREMWQDVSDGGIIVPPKPPAPAPVKPAPAPASKAPTFPLPAGWYFGPRTGPRECVSGYYHRLPSGEAGHPGLLLWQKRMRDRGWKVVPDGLYGNQTADVARSFGAEKRIPGGRDDLIGLNMWRAAWVAPIT